MKAINYYVVVDRIKDKQKKIAGLIITEQTDKEGRYHRGKVVSKGNLVEGINEGDIVSYDRHAGHAITWEDEVYYVVKLADIVIIE